MAAIGEEEIIKLLESRDENGIAALREKYGRLIRSIAYGILHSEQDAEECESEVLLRVWNSIPPESPRSLCGYVCKIARCAALDRWDYARAAKRSGDTLPIDELEEAIAGTSAAEDRLSERELSRLLNEFLSKQNKTTRIIFMRRYWFGDSIAETAQRIGAGESMVKSRISRTLAKLRKFLEKEGYYL